MGRIIITENVTLDGVTADPVGDEGFGRGGWANQLEDSEREAWAEYLFGEALEAEALLMGRRSDAWFAARWLSRSGAWADRLNSMPKYVLSAALREASWGNATILGGDVVDEVLKLKDRLAGDIVVYASSQLVHTLMEHDLADELRLIVYPVVLGAGPRLFGETSESRRVRLIETRTLGSGLACLRYQVVRDA
jgi:dihydrofolate reductase